MASLWSAGKPTGNDDGKPEDAELVAETAEETEVKGAALTAEIWEEADAPDDEAEDLSLIHI